MEVDVVMDFMKTDKGRNKFNLKLGDVPFYYFAYDVGDDAGRIITSWDAEVKERKPGMKRKFGMVTPLEHDTEFLFIYEYNHPVTGPVLWVENPKRYTSRSLSGYYWSIINNRREDYWDDIFKFPVLCSPKSFSQFLRRIELSPFMEDSNYWAQAEYGNLLLEKVKDGAIIFAPQEQQN